MAADVIANARAYWEKIRGDRSMPTRASLDPIDIPPLLPFVMLVDVLRNPLDFRFRLIGTEVSLIISGNYRGVRFSDLPHMAPGNKVWSEYEEVVTTRKPLFSAVDYVGSNRYVRGIQHCLMPFSADGETVDLIFVAVEIHRR